jgi:hypothetical protein
MIGIATQGAEAILEALVEAKVEAFASDCTRTWMCGEAAIKEGP